MRIKYTIIDLPVAILTGKMMINQWIWGYI